jgi:hypothetical protein
VCRYSQTLRTSHPSSANASRSTSIPFADPVAPALSSCADCNSTTSLWICLICGNIGCGRYGRAHAHAHYERTTHLYALELETQRVWDYAGDGYVHRLIQNKADGKLVELPSASMRMGDDTGAGGPARRTRSPQRRSKRSASNIRIFSPRSSIRSARFTRSRRPRCRSKSQTSKDVVAQLPAGGRVFARGCRGRREPSASRGGRTPFGSPPR